MRFVKRPPWPLLLALAAGCAAPEQDEPDDGITLLDPRAQLIRLSVDLRGVHPTEVELQAIEDHPELYDDYVDRYLEDPRFLDRMELIFNQRFLTLTGETYFDLDDAGLTGADEQRVAQALGHEPLKLVRHIVENDLPWTELVLADYTMADPFVAGMWGLKRDSDDPGWVTAHYTDGRPEAGVLTMTTIWQRYPSAGVNGNRHRANAVSRMLLCEDYLARPVSFARTTIDSLTSGDPEAVIRETATCQSCHSSLDPLAGHFFGFWWEKDGGFAEQTTYFPEDEWLWRQYSGKSPAYYGRPTANIEELAQAISEDDRFVGCAVDTVFEALTQRDVTEVDWSETWKHRDAFESGGLVMRDLVRSIVTSREYKAAAFDDERGERIPTVKMVDPAQLSGIVKGETGYAWTMDGWDALATNTDGLAVLAGGIDSQFVTTPSHEPSVGMVFVQERLAQAAAHSVAVHDLDPNRADDAVLLKYVTIEDLPETNPDAFEAQIRDLYLEITGEPLPDDAPEPDDLASVWKQLYSVDASPVSAWAGIISIVLRDPAVLMY